jgi:hypothetical protein
MAQADVLTPAGEVRTRQGTFPSTGSDETYWPGAPPDALANGGLFCVVANCLLRILPLKLPLSRLLSLDVLLTSITADGQAVIRSEGLRTQNPRSPGERRESVRL